MMRRSALVAALVLGLGSVTQAQLPAGYSPQPVQSLPDSLREVRGGGRFTITIERTARDSVERRLIEQAESLFPSVSTIEKTAVLDLTHGGNVRAFEAAKQFAGPRWWWREWDGVLLPYALTGAAVAHYVDRVRQLSIGGHPFPQLSEGTSHTASVTYTAQVRALPATSSAPGGHEVHLQVEFSFYCGPLCALSFTHERVVEFDASGKVIAIRGDRPPVFEVS
jgi:hypothetical protein